jgi:cell division protein FtsN
VQDRVYGEADLLDLLKKVSARLWVPTQVPKDAKSGKEASYWVQIGAYNQLENAETAYQIMYDNGYNVQLEISEGAGIKYKVRLGPFDSKLSAEDTIERLRAILYEQTN